MAFSKMTGFEVRPRNPHAVIMRSSSPPVSSPRWMKSSQGLWPKSSSALTGLVRLASSSLAISVLLFTPPRPLLHFRHVLAVLVNILLVLDQLVANVLLSVGRAGPQFRHPIDNVANQVEAIDVVEHRHIERRGRCSLFLVAADMQVVMIRAPVRQPVNQPWVAVIGEDNRFIARKDRVEVAIRQSVRMLCFRLQRHQVDDVDYPHLQLRQLLAE